MSDTATSWLFDHSCGQAREVRLGKREVFSGTEFVNVEFVTGGRCCVVASEIATTEAHAKRIGYARLLRDTEAELRDARDKVADLEAMVDLYTVALQVAEREDARRG